jgi:3-dehydroquinate synthase
MNRENNFDNIVLDDGIFDAIEKYIESGKFSSIFIITDENVNRHCLPVLIERCVSLKESTVIEIPSGEEEKNLTVFARIISLLLEKNADRKSLIVNLGGGVICDLGGFTSSVFKRGVRFINIPTTLLSMADASIGGKNGINFLERKNVIGTFTNPEKIFIYPNFIKTLDPPEIKSGYAEIIKCILLYDATAWQLYSANISSLTDEKNLVKLIELSAKTKSKIIAEDFREEGKRMQLNFGHTFGHAIESFSLSINQPIRHGEAIAIGMTGELFLSCKLTGFPESEMIKAIALLKNVFNEIHFNFLPEDIIPFLYADKKNARDKIAFSLLKSPGIPSPVIYPELDLIVEGLIFMSEEFSSTTVQ